MLASGQPIHGEIYILRRDDRDIWLSFNGRPLFQDDSGRPTAAAVSFTDVTESRAAHQALKASEEKFRLLADNMADVVWSVDRNLRFIYVSPSVDKLLGYTPSEIMARAHTSLVHPDSRPVAVRLQKQLVSLRERKNGEATLLSEYAMMAKDGRKVLVETLVKAVWDEQGDWRGYSGVTRDISERRHAEEALRESEQKHRALFSGAGDAIFLLRDQRLVDCNPKTVEMFACQREEIIGRTPIAFSAPTQTGGQDSRQMALEKMDAALAGRPQVFEWLHQRGNGEIFPAEISLTRLELGGRPHILAMVRDITERKQAEKALKASEERFRLLADNMADVVWTLDRDRKFTYISPSVKRLLGYDPSELDHLSPRAIMPKDWQGAATQIKNQMRALQGQDPAKAVLVVESLLRAKDGREVMVESVIRQLYNNQGESIGYTGASRDVTERKKAERALKASEEKFSRLYMTSPVWMSLNRVKDGVYLEVNQAFEHLTGFGRGQAVGKTALGLGLWPDPSARARIIAKFKARGSLHREPVELRMRSGQRRRFLWSAERMTLQDEQVMLSVLLDVTELEQAKQALAESEQSFRTVVENSLAGIYVVQGGRFTYVNPRLAQMMGYSSPAELEGTNPWDLVHPDDREGLRQMGVSRGDESRRTVQVTLRALAKDGGVLWLEAMGARANYRGHPANVGNVIDITQRKRAEQALKESEEQHRLLVSTALDAIYIIQDGKLVFANPMVERITGRSAQELAETYFTELLHPEDLDLVIRRYQQRLAGENAPDNYPMRVVATDGNTRWIQASAATLTWKGRPAILYVARDISEQRRMEARLRHSQKLEAVGTLAGGIAHDFNNILAAIMGYTELSLDEVPAGGRLAKNLTEVLNASKRARDLVRQILSFSRQSKHKLRPLSLATAVKEVLRLIRASIPSNVALASDLTSEARVMADPVQIHQLLMNLCANAAQALEDRGGTIRVGLERVELAPGDEAVGPTLPPGPYLLLSVADDGPGVPAEVRERIFEPFFTTKETGRGSGLGLSAVHGIVQGHQGSIRLEDRPGGGTVFKILLPEVDQEFEEQALPPEPPRAKEGERVMFVDDEPALVEIARNILSRLGYQVEAHNSSTEALAAFQARPDAFDLVITDQTMPGLTGAALVKEIKNLRPELPVIIATGFSRQLSPEQAQKAGVSAFVMKPITSQEVALTVRRVLDGERDG